MAGEPRGMQNPTWISLQETHDPLVEGYLSHGLTRISGEIPADQNYDEFESVGMHAHHGQ